MSVFGWGKCFFFAFFASCASDRLVIVRGWFLCCEHERSQPRERQTAGVRAQLHVDGTQFRFRVSWRKENKKTRKSGNECSFNAVQIRFQIPRGSCFFGVIITSWTLM